MRGSDGTTVSIDSGTISRTGDSTFMVRTATRFPETMELEDGRRFTREIDVEELNCGADSIRGFVSQLYADTVLVHLVPLPSTWEPVANNRRPVFAASCAYLLGSFAAALPRSYGSEAVEVLPQLANRRAAAEALAREYPPRMLAAGQRGQVLLRFRITEEGEVDRTTVSLVSFSDAAFAAAAIRVVGTLRFRPARFRGRAVRVWITLPLTFDTPPANTTLPSDPPGGRRQPPFP
jgi:TonB family protein